MHRKNSLTLTYASGAQLVEDRHFWIYVQSLRNVKADHVILTHDLDENVEQRLLQAGILEVARVPAKRIRNLLWDRHWAYWDYLRQHPGYSYVVISDCRDVVFQDNPFCLLRKEITLPSEGFQASRSGFACIDHFEFQRDLPLEYCFELGDLPVVNGGVSMGRRPAILNHHFLLWCTLMKTRPRCTDQAALNWLMNSLIQTGNYHISCPQEEHFCLTGEGVKEGLVDPMIIRDKICREKDRYTIVHQWDRVESLKNAVLAQFAV